MLSLLMNGMKMGTSLNLEKNSSWNQMNILITYLWMSLWVMSKCQPTCTTRVSRSVFHLTHCSLQFVKECIYLPSQTFAWERLHTLNFLLRLAFVLYDPSLGITNMKPFSSVFVILGALPAINWLDCISISSTKPGEPNISLLVQPCPPQATWPVME